MGLSKIKECYRENLRALLSFHPALLLVPTSRTGRLISLISLASHNKNLPFCVIQYRYTYLLRITLVISNSGEGSPTFLPADPFRTRWCSSMQCTYLPCPIMQLQALCLLPFPISSLHRVAPYWFACYLSVRCNSLPEWHVDIVHVSNTLEHVCIGPFFSLQDLVDRMKKMSNGDNLIKFPHFSDLFVDPVRKSTVQKLVSSHALDIHVQCLS